ncbi:hypothetical protein Tco_1457420 [Tanacetum coccineum]
MVEYRRVLATRRHVSIRSFDVNAATRPQVGLGHFQQSRPADLQVGYGSAVRYYSLYEIVWKIVHEIQNRAAFVKGVEVKLWQI